MKTTPSSSVWLVGGALMTSLSIGAPVSAQIVPDNTLPVNSSVTPGCTTCIINGGTVRGGNLFHSFEQFSVPTNGTAWFNNAPQIQNILTRVTGFPSSNIDGLLKTNGSANLFLLNPNGIIFGRNARSEIGGSFTATTATSFQFANGTEFSTINPQAPPLLAVNLTQGLQYGPLSSASVIVNGANLNMPQSLKLFTQILDVSGQLQTGKDLTLEAAVIGFRGQLQAGQHLTLQGSDISIYDDPIVPFSAQAGGNLSFQAAALDFNGFNRRILLTSGGLMNLSSDYEIVGDFHFVSGNSFVLGGFHSTGGAQLRSPGGSVISAGGDVEMPYYLGGSLLIEAKGNIQISGIGITPPFANNPFPFVNTDTVLATMPGVIIRSGQTNLLYHNNQTPSIAYTGSTLPMGISGSGISMFTVTGSVFLTAPKGNVTLGRVETLGGDVLVQSAGGISGDFNTSNGVNDGGNVTLIAQNGDLLVNVDTSSSYYSSYGIPSVAVASGNGGNVTLSTVNGNINVYDRIKASSYSMRGGSGNGGNVTLSTLNGNINVAEEIDTFSYSGQGGSGNGGNISISTVNGNITIAQPNSLLGLSSFSKDESFNTPGTIYPSGKAGNVTVSTLNGFIDLRGYVLAYSRASSGNSGGGGNVDFSAINGEIFVTGIDTDSFAHNTNSAKGGNIRLLAINGDIHTERLSSGSINVQGNSTDGGSISVISTGGSIFLVPSSIYEVRISSASVSDASGNSGNGGDILLSARDGDIVGISFGPPNLQSFSAAQQGTSGQGGNITLEAKNRISGLEIISLSSTGKAGDIQIHGFGDLSVANLSILSALSSPFTYPFTSQSGRIIFTSTGNLTLNNSRIASTTVGSNPADDITITSAGTTTLNNSFITSQTSGAGDGADITVTAQSLNLLQGSQIATSTSGSGQAGDITILVDDQLWLSGAGAGLFSSATPGATGGAGNITIDPDLVLIEDGATISIDNQGTGRGGDIDLVAGDLVLRNQGAITTNTTSPQGGNIILTIQNALSLQGNSVISTSAGTPQVGGSGGNITITALSILSSMAENSDIVANAFNGTGGNIILNTQEMVGLQRQPQRTANSDITSSGNFSLNLPTQPVSFPAQPISFSAQQIQLNPSNQNSETISQPYFSSQAIDATTTLTQSCNPVSSSASAKDAIVEAQGWVVQPDGSIELVGQTANPLVTEACTF